RTVPALALASRSFKETSRSRGALTSVLSLNPPHCLAFLRDTFLKGRRRKRGARVGIKCMRMPFKVAGLVETLLQFSKRSERLFGPAAKACKWPREHGIEMGHR